MEEKMLKKIKKTAINSAFIVGTAETKEKNIMIMKKKIFLY